MGRMGCDIWGKWVACTCACAARERVPECAPLRATTWERAWERAWERERHLALALDQNWCDEESVAEGPHLEKKRKKRINF